METDPDKIDELIEKSAYALLAHETGPWESDAELVDFKMRRAKSWAVFRSRARAVLEAVGLIQRT